MARSTGKIPVMTGLPLTSPSFKKRFETSRYKIRAQIDGLEALVRNHPEEKAAVDKITDLLTVSVENL